MPGKLKPLLAAPASEDELTNDRAHLLNIIMLFVIALVPFLYLVRFCFVIY